MQPGVLVAQRWRGESGDKSRGYQVRRGEKNWVGGETLRADSRQNGLFRQLDWAFGIVGEDNKGQGGFGPV